ncbi:MAG: hypothetical protein HFF04_04310 [Oscillospiraceae bacterium]|nr:hypothetical protein [Oscillospiraceae bacterium]
MKKQVLKLALLASCLSMLLTGCFFRSVDELYAIPQPSKDYEALQVRLSEAIAQGGEYAAPLSGEMIQAVQLQDLDGDGKQEAIAFFRFAGDEKPLKIYIFRQQQESYELLTMVEHAGTAINCVDYVQLDDTPFREMVVSWQISDKVRSLAAYSLGHMEAEELIRTDYDSYKLYDLDQDNQQELVVFRTPMAGSPQAEMYDFDGDLSLAGTAPLSRGIASGADEGIRAGYLVDRVPALFAVSGYGGSGTITDVFVSRNGELRNVTLDPETEESGETVRFYTQVYETDINSDGITEIPQPLPLAEYKLITETVNFWLIHWRQFDVEGAPTRVFTTYHNDRDGWYFVLPDEWVSHLSLSRSDLTGSGERAVTFSYWTGEENSEPQSFLTIYRLTGSNRSLRANRGERFILTESGDTIYAAEFRDGWDCGLTQEEVKARFNLIKTDWYNGT